jgi:hypothetical protein
MSTTGAMMSVGGREVEAARAGASAPVMHTSVDGKGEQASSLALARGRQRAGRPVREAGMVTTYVVMTTLKVGRIPLTTVVCLVGQALAQPARPSPDTRQAGQAPLVSPAEDLKLPSSEIWLGTVRIPRRVMPNGQPLATGRCRVRLTIEHVTKEAVGQTERLERWVEFVQGGEVRGRETRPIVPEASVPLVAEQRPPRPGR